MYALLFYFDMFFYCVTKLFHFFWETPICMSIKTYNVHINNLHIPNFSSCTILLSRIIWINHNFNTAWIKQFHQIQNLYPWIPFHHNLSFSMLSPSIQNVWRFHACAFNAPPPDQNPQKPKIHLNPKTEFRGSSQNPKIQKRVFLL